MGVSEDKVALVTGAGSGLGRGIAELFAERGAAVIAADIDEDSAQATVDSMSGSNVRALPVGVDVADPNAVDNLVERAVAEFGRLDLAVNCAGVAGPGKPIDECSNDEWQRILNINLNGVFYGMRAQIRAMLLSGGGAIVNISSGTAVDPVPRMSAYNASKSGVVALTRTAAGENVRRGIRVNAVLPGAIDTPMNDKHGRTPEGRRNLENRLSMGRMGRPREIAETVLFLCSDAASYITGAALLVDGGSHAYRD